MMIEVIERIENMLASASQMDLHQTLVIIISQPFRTLFLCSLLF